MARYSSGPSAAAQVVRLAAVGLAGMVLYRLAKDGSLGAFPASLVGSAAAAVAGATGGSAPGRAAARPSGSRPAATGSLPTMEASNPNIGQQIGTWQSERIARGEDPYDWSAFRRHAMAIYAPDPGPNPPPLFVSATGGGVSGVL